VDTGAGNVELITDELDHTVDPSYDPAGQVLSVKDQLGQVTTFSDYDSNGLPQTVTMPLRSGDAHPNAWSYTYDLAGNIRTMTSPRGAFYKTTLGYDSLDRLTSIENPKDAATSSYVTQHWTYDANDNVLTHDPGDGHTSSSIYTAMDLLKDQSTPTVPH